MMRKVERDTYWASEGATHFSRRCSEENSIILTDVRPESLYFLFLPFYLSLFLFRQEFISFSIPLSFLFILS